MPGLPLESLTELEAVNTMLESIGEIGVDTLDEQGFDKADIARRLLHRINRRIQEQGINANTEYNVEFTPSSSDEIILPGNVLSIDGHKRDKQYERRGNRLYDLENKTFTFTKPVKVDVVWFLPFDELPSHAKTYIAVTALRDFQARQDRNTIVIRFNNVDWLDARRQFFHNEGKSRDANMKKWDTHKKIFYRRPPFPRVT